MIRSYWIWLLSVLFIAIILRLLVFDVYKVPTDVMMPTLLPGDIVLGSQITYGFGGPFGKEYKKGGRKPLYGDVIVFKNEDAKGGLLVRRVIGLPGDFIVVQNGKLFINERFDRDFEKDFSYGPIVVPQDQVFVISDNKTLGDEMRYMDYVKIQDIESRLLWVVFSFEWDQGWDSTVRWSRFFKSLN